ncbi:MAG: sugar phosphate isomerase/epimerase, partial [Planctomycetes bacterium]|nr:sugar phosphate isomerase/epimerase [Planctomycetota bacterium]
TKVFAVPAEASAAQLTAYRDAWKVRGIEIVAMQALLFGRPELTVFGAPQVRDATLRHLAAMARIGGQLGAHTLVFGSPRNRSVAGLPLSEVAPRAIEFFRAAGQAAAPHGVALCIEPVPRAFGGDFVLSAREALALVRDVDHPGFGLHLDAAALTSGDEPPAAAVERCAPAIRHFHASEPGLVLLGEGGVDHRQLGRCLRAIGYRGTVSVEMLHDPARDPLEGLRRALGVLLDCYG